MLKPLRKNLHKRLLQSEGLLQPGGAVSFEEGMEIEYESAVKLAGTRDFSEGIQAFLEKRKPDWE